MSGNRSDSPPQMGTASGMKSHEIIQAEIDAATGKRFGSLTLVRRTVGPGAKDGHARVDVLCDCGHEKSVRFRQVLSGALKTCGTRQHIDAHLTEKHASRIGERFGSLTVTSIAISSGRHRTRAWVTCDCGSTKMVSLSDLIAGSVSTCGGDRHGSAVPSSARIKRWEVHGKCMTYAIRAVGTNVVKIGVARNLEERVRKMQFISPVELVVFAVSNDNIETSMHAALHRYRAHGEWFSATDEVLSLIAERMQPTSMSTISSARVQRGRSVGVRLPCKACGEFGHYAKTCSKRFSRLTPEAFNSGDS